MFKIDKRKYLVRLNSIEFDDYITKNYNNKKFLLICRLEKEKLQSIKNGIDLFSRYCLKLNNNKLILDKHYRRWKV